MNIYRGLILTYPYGTLIKNHAKKIIVKSKKMALISNKLCLLIENKQGLGIIVLAEPKEINLTQFKKLFVYHKITEADRLEWWPNYKILYVYPIIKSTMFKKPLLLNYVPGPQITITPSNIHLKKIFIGTSGLTDRNSFDTYAAHLNSIEINYTFYRNPTKKFISNLQMHNLTYTIKVNRLITHYSTLTNIKSNWNNFYRLFSPIKNKIICFLFQFSAKFILNKNNFIKLNKLSKYLDPSHLYAFEFRNRVWFDNMYVDKLFKRNRWIKVVVHVNNDDKWAGDLRNGFNPSLSRLSSTTSIYLRLHGTTGQYTGSYAPAGLEKIYKLISTKQFDSVFIYFNNTDDGRKFTNAWTNALKLTSKINHENLYREKKLKNKL